MPVENLDPPGVPLVEGISQVSIATGSRIVFFSGQIGRKPDGAPAGDDLRSQTCQTLKNLEAVAKSVGVESSHIAKWTLFIKNYSAEAFEAYMAGFGDYLEGGGSIAPTAAGTLVGVAEFFEPWILVELEAIAVID